MDGWSDSDSAGGERLPKIKRMHGSNMEREGEGARGRGPALG